MTRAKSCKAIRLLAMAATTLGAGCGASETMTSPTAAVTSPITVSYSTMFGPRGAAARAFTASQAGTVSVTLLSARPPSDVSLGLGVGIPRADGGGCTLAASVTTQAGPTPQVTAAVDAGLYCVSVFDVGVLIDSVSVTISLTHP